MTTAIERRHVATTFALIGLAASTSALAQEWEVTLAGESNELIEVIVSTLHAPTDQVIDYVDFNVTFLDAQRTRLAERRYSFLDQKLPSLLPGRIYKRQFIHDLPSPGPAEVVGFNLRFDAAPAGDDALTALNPAKTVAPSGVATTVISSPGTYTPTKFDLCQQYASAAVAASKENSAKHCGFSGSRWDSRFGFHYNWCLTAPAADARTERRARGQMLTSCNGGQ